MAVKEATKNEDLVTTDILDVPEDVADGYFDGSEKKIFKTDLVYSKQRFRHDVLQMLRLCSMKGYDDAVIEGTERESSADFLYDAGRLAVLCW